MIGMGSTAVAIVKMTSKTKPSKLEQKKIKDLENQLKSVQTVLKTQCPESIRKHIERLIDLELKKRGIVEEYSYHL